MTHPSRSSKAAGAVKYRLLIFDFDGTLADSFPMFLKHLEQVVAHFGLRRVDGETLETLRGRGARELLDVLGVPAWKLPLIVRYMRRVMAEDVVRTSLFPEVPEVLRRLSEAGVVVAIVSSNSEANIRAVLGPERAAWVSVYACGASLFGKAAKFRRVLRKTGTAAGEALAIGDEIRDLEAAREAGIDFGAVAWGFTKVEAFAGLGTAFVFRNPKEILNVEF